MRKERPEEEQRNRHNEPLSKRKVTIRLNESMTFTWNVDVNTTMNFVLNERVTIGLPKNSSG